MKLGIIGLSEGNGHPYSWSAIFNGYTPEMAECPYPGIPAYLSRQRFPEDSLSGLAQVTHVWCPDAAEAHRIARATRIPNVCRRLEDLLEADGILLARDDAENHVRFASPFLDAGKPIYIDKPIAHRCADLDDLWKRQRWEGQIFSCSALRYSQELRWGDSVGSLRYIHGSFPKKWETYAVHVIEPVVAHTPEIAWSTGTTQVSRGSLTHLLDVQVDDVRARFVCTGAATAGIRLHVIGDRGEWTGALQDSFGAFREALRSFVLGATPGSPLPIPRRDTRETVHLIEAGLK